MVKNLPFSRICKAIFYHILLLNLLAGIPLRAQVSVLSYHNDLANSGCNLDETTLNTTNVQPGSFGKLWTDSVSGQVYARPLIVSGVYISGVKHNILIVADMHNDVYAFDADGPDYSQIPLWKVNLGASVPLPNSQIAEGSSYTDIRGEIGITSTPAIDTSTNTLYVLAKTLVGGVFADSLHALDLSTGAPKFGGAQVISATIAGTGEGGTTISFQSNRQNQRSALVLYN